MSRGRVVVHKAAVERLRGRRDVGEALQDRMKKVHEAAYADAPVVSGEYRASLRTELVDNGGVQSARVVAGVPYAIYVEAEHGTLSRALDAAAD